MKKSFTLLALMVWEHIRPIQNDTTTNKQNAVAPYTNIYDVILAGSPFVDAAHDDFRLNQNTNGAACRSTGVPRSFNGLTGNRNFIDIGAVGHQDPGFAG